MTTDDAMTTAEAAWWQRLTKALDECPESIRLLVTHDGIEAFRAEDGVVTLLARHGAMWDYGPTP